MVTDEGGYDCSKQEGERRVRLHRRQRRVQAFQHGNVGVPTDRPHQRKRRRQYGERSRHVETTMLQARTNGVVTCFHLVESEMAGTLARTLPAATCHLVRVTTAEQVTLGNISLSCGNFPWSECRRMPAPPRPATARMHQTKDTIGHEAVVGRELHQDVELFTPHDRGAHAASRAKTGFRIYVVASRGGGGRSGPRPRGMEEFLSRTNILATGPSTASASAASPLCATAA